MTFDGVSAVDSMGMVSLVQTSCRIQNLLLLKSCCVAQVTENKLFQRSVMSFSVAELTQ